jgi:hypothetical protein
MQNVAENKALSVLLVLLVTGREKKEREGEVVPASASNESRNKEL